MSGNEGQADYWASPAGLKWIEHEHALDTAMAGMLDAMLDAARIAPLDRVVDVGCGTGASTIGAAQRVPNGQAVGIDISKPLLERAAKRAAEAGLANTTFILADAQTHNFGETLFDVLVSRIGMSFFSDTVAALENLSSALADDGRMVFVCWAAVEENPWFYIPKLAAEERLGALPKTDPRAPGPTAFQEIAYVTELMEAAGLTGIEARPISVDLTPPGGAKGAAKAASRVGPAARILKAHRGTSEDERWIEDQVAAAFEAFDKNGQARVPSEVNLFTARVRRS